MEYALFCPRKLLKSSEPPDSREILATIPLAMQSGDGAFVQQFRDWERKTGLDAPIKLECDSFPQACRAISSGEFATILPTIARNELSKNACWELPLPFLNREPRQICLAWNPRTLRLRNEAIQVCETLKAVLKMN